MYNENNEEHLFSRNTNKKMKDKLWGGKDIFTNYYDKRLAPRIQK